MNNFNLILIIFLIIIFLNNIKKNNYEKFSDQATCDGKIILDNENKEICFENSLEPGVYDIFDDGIEKQEDLECHNSCKVCGSNQEDDCYICKDGYTHVEDYNDGSGHCCNGKIILDNEDKEICFENSLEPGVYDIFDDGIKKQEDLECHNSCKICGSNQEDDCFICKDGYTHIEDHNDNSGKCLHNLKTCKYPVHVLRTDKPGEPWDIDLDLQQKNDKSLTYNFGPTKGLKQKEGISNSNGYFTQCMKKPNEFYKHYSKIDQDNFMDGKYSFYDFYGMDNSHHKSSFNTPYTFLVCQEKDVTKCPTANDQKKIVKKHFQKNKSDNCKYPIHVRRTDDPGKPWKDDLYVKCNDTNHTLGIGSSDLAQSNNDNGYYTFCRDKPMEKLNLQEFDIDYKWGYKKLHTEPKPKNKEKNILLKDTSLGRDEYEIKKIKSSSIDECKNMCDKEEKFFAFEFDKVKKDCYLKNWIKKDWEKEIWSWPYFNNNNNNDLYIKKDSKVGKKIIPKVKVFYYDDKGKKKYLSQKYIITEQIMNSDNVKLDDDFIEIKKDNKCPNNADKTNIYLDTYTEYPEISQEWGDYDNSLVTKGNANWVDGTLKGGKTSIFRELDGFKRKPKDYKDKVKEFCYKEGQRRGAKAVEFDNDFGWCYLSYNVTPKVNENLTFDLCYEKDVNNCKL